MRPFRKPRTQKIARELSKILRKNATYSEILLWRVLRKKKIKNHRFLRQHPIFFRYDNRLRFFIADFYCYELNLIIEVDGPIHNRQKDFDQIRTALLNNKDLKVIRFSNDEIINDIKKVSLQILAIISEIEATKSHT